MITRSSIKDIIAKIFHHLCLLRNSNHKFIYVRYYCVILVILGLLEFGCRANAQSYDVENNIPPQRHTEKSKRYISSPFFDEKYKLLVDRACENGSVIIDIKIEGASAPFSILSSNDTIFVSLIASAFKENKQMNTNIVIPYKFNICVTMEKDTAWYSVSADSKSKVFIIDVVKRAPFIELESVLELPENIFWIQQKGSLSSRVIGKIIKQIEKEKLGQYIVLDEGYYRCFPSKYIRKKGNRNKTSTGNIIVFKYKNRAISTRREIENIVEDYDAKVQFDIDFFDKI